MVHQVPAETPISTCARAGWRPADLDPSPGLLSLYFLLCKLGTIMPSCRVLEGM